MSSILLSSISNFSISQTKNKINTKNKADQHKSKIITPKKKKQHTYNKTWKPKIKQKKENSNVLRLVVKAVHAKEAVANLLP